MSEEGLKAEIRRLVKENEQLRADLRAERGEGYAGELRVTRWGTDQVDPATFHIRLSVSTVRAACEGSGYVDLMLAQMRYVIGEELRRRRFMTAAEAQKNPPRAPERA